MSAVFVAGTGTDIGKTFITVALIHELRRRGRDVDALKPVVSGFDPARLADSDPGCLLAALDRTPTQTVLDHMSPWRYAAPLSPDMAARRAGKPLDFKALIHFTQRRIEDAPGHLFIEGIGGVTVPLDDRHTTLDWLEALRIPVLLVAGTYLGAISHALTAIAALQQRALGLKAIIVNESPASGVDLDETTGTIQRFVGAVETIALPRLASSKTSHPTLQRLADLL